MRGGVSVGGEGGLGRGQSSDRDRHIDRFKVN